MRVVSLQTAQRLARQYAVTTDALRDRASEKLVWTLRLGPMLLETSGGKEILVLLEERCAPTSSTSRRSLKEEEASAYRRLSRRLLRLFSGKTGVPGRRGWFRFTELVAISDPRTGRRVDLKIGRALASNNR